jgi:hypothetical protein
MGSFYDLPPKIQVFLYVGGIIVGILALLFWAFRIALKAQRKRESERKKGVTINITIKDVPSV